MEEPTISGPPRVIGWDPLLNGPRLEVPLSMPLDQLWLAVDLKERKRQGDTWPASIEIDAHDELETRKLVLAFGWWKPADVPVSTPPPGMEVRGPDTWTTEAALDWLAGHLDRVGTEADQYRRRLAEHRETIEAEAVAWWEATSEEE